MDKKYKLIKEGFNWPRVKALKDFTLITGEKVKKGDIGGYVYSEDCLSQEGNCWVMDYAFVRGSVEDDAVIKNYARIHGTVSENAVVKDHAAVYGDVFGDPIIKDYAKIYGSVSGNAIIKDSGYVGIDGIATCNAVVQAYQRINYGLVTKDILGTKDWTGALYAELGIFPEDGKVLLYKVVRSTENPEIFRSWHKPSFVYQIEKETVETDVNEDVMNCCGKGLHFTTLEFINFYRKDTIIECEIDLKDILTVQANMVRARKCKVVKVYKRE